ncbi:MAG: DEAD/DEAH box helicase [Bdellovibrionaceae bacterium]|nr:DEAD/DEAH box helicase [Pseudobdellovibrionaceae bacterium]
MQLPIDPYLASIAKLLEENQNVLVQSSPGSGKTTRIPPYLTPRFKKILVIEPRRIAAIYASARIAEEKNWELGEQVGYEVRFESKKNAQTCILFLTEALLAKKIIADPELKGVDLIIFDEFHERSIWTDLAIGHLREMQILGANIQLLFLSATIDKAPLISFFEKMGMIEIELPRFPIEVIYQRKPIRYQWNDEFENSFLSSLQEIIQKGKHQILVFLPGLKEIRRASLALENNLKFKNYKIEVLHGSVPLNSQKSIVRNDNSIPQRIILATNIAESSLTIAGVTAVLDSGLHREATYNFDYDIQQLNTRKISLFSAIQRQGRANRLGPGLCFKMWTELDERSMEKAPIADIKKSSLFELGLYLTYMGHGQLHQFTWFEPPTAEVLSDLQETYIESGLCIDRTLTPLGKLAMELSLSYENTLLFALSYIFYSLEKAALVIAVLESDYSANQNGHSSQSTLMDALDDIQQNRNRPYEIDKRASQLRNGFSKTLQQHNWLLEFERLFSSPQHKIFFQTVQSFKKTENAFELILAFAYHNRLCRRRRQENGLSHRAVTTNGKEIQISEPSKTNQLPALEYLLSFNAVIDANNVARCFSYHFVNEDTLATAVRPFAKNVSRIEFSSTKQQFYKTTELILKKMTLETLATEPLAPEELKEKTQEILMLHLETMILNLAAVEEFMTRLKWLNQNASTPVEISWDEILEQEIHKGLTLKNRTDWVFDLESYLSFEAQKLIRHHVPKELSIKNLNRTFKIQYPKNETPLVAARLQHFLGLAQHPTILNGQIKLKIVLLGPHGRPIQITNDLPGFWKTSYPEIRKEMKGRYPKHAWPEDPTSS